MQTENPPVGGAFLMDVATPDQIMTPEELSSDARLMAKSIEDFVRKEVVPLKDRIDAQEEGLMLTLVRKAGALGLLGGAVPDLYGGLDLPKSTITAIVEKAALDASFSVSVGAHTVIGSLPVLYFGTPEQKQKYLPKLATGEYIGAFALSEANCGSDAFSSQCKATLAEDGKHYLLNGTKMWTTNAGFADLFTIFAKVDGEHLTAFLVEKETPGLSLGREEHKLGLKGSSTRRVILDNARVPVENVLGEVGKGYRAAIYILNIGRFNLGAGAVGSCKEVIKIAAQYALQRTQFGTSISNFGLIKHKLAEMTIRTFVTESMLYRVAGYWDRLFEKVDASSPDANNHYRQATEEYAIECAIMKFFGSEVLDYVVDEGLQIHGGFGYTEEFPMARAYRDARINRIFEGTSEINRLTVVDQVVRRAMKGRLNLPAAAAKLKETLLAGPTGMPGSLDDPLEEIGVAVEQIRNALLYVAGQGFETLGPRLAEEQEIVAACADMAAALFALESAWLRANKLKGKITPQNFETMVAAVQTFGYDASAQADQLSRYALAAFSSGDTLRAHLSSIRRLLKPPALNTVALRRQIAGVVLERESYPF